MYNLSICFSTKNRKTTLISCLQKIFISKNIKKKKLEIVIFDGSKENSENEIFNLVYDKNIFSIKYFHDPKDFGGLDGAFDRSVKNSLSEYCYISSDDDDYSPYLIENILNLIKSKKDLYILNTKIMDSKLEKVLDPNRLNLLKDLEFTYTKNERIIDEKYIDQLSYIGCVVIKKSIWKKYNSEIYYNSFFAHFSNIFDSQNQISIYTQKKPFIYCRIDSESWSSKHLLLWHFYYPQLKNMIYKKFSALNRSEIVSDIPFKILFKYYALGLLDNLSNVKVSIQLRNKINRLFNINKKVVIILCLIHTYINNNKILRYRLLKRI
jgi:abequosyltransferase